uniref:Blastula protease 10 n=1 Tax=Talaromyces marneffei PM1 TaxID=1077442 RepID=A0A093UMR1_TALMA
MPANGAARASKEELAAGAKLIAGGLSSRKSKKRADKSEVEIAFRHETYKQDIDDYNKINHLFKAITNNRERSFVELITKFENSTKAKHGGSVYATLGGDNAGSNGSNQGNLNNNKLKKRWCGELRLVYDCWEKCAYLNE